MSADVSSLANTGFIVVRNSLWTRSFLRDWLALRDQPGIQTEQLGFDALYRTRDAGEMRQKVAILPAHVMNSIAAPMGEQQPHHKVGFRTTASRNATLSTIMQRFCALLLMCVLGVCFILIAADIASCSGVHSPARGSIASGGAGGVRGAGAGGAARKATAGRGSQLPAAHRRSYVSLSMMAFLCTPTYAACG
jgi:hypothetical protein